MSNWSGEVAVFRTNPLPAKLAATWSPVMEFAAIAPAKIYPLELVRVMLPEPAWKTPEVSMVPAAEMELSQPLPMTMPFSVAVVPVISATLMPAKVSPPSVLPLVEGLIFKPINVWLVGSMPKVGVISNPIGEAKVPAGETFKSKDVAPMAEAMVVAASTDIVSEKSVKSRLSSVMSAPVMAPSAISAAPMDSLGSTTSLFPVPSVRTVNEVVTVLEPITMEVAVMVPISSSPAEETSSRPVPKSKFPVPCICKVSPEASWTVPDESITNVPSEVMESELTANAPAEMVIPPLPTIMPLSQPVPISRAVSVTALLGLVIVLIIIARKVSASPEVELIEISNPLFLVAPPLLPWLKLIDNPSTPSAVTACPLFAIASKSTVGAAIAVMAKFSPAPKFIITLSTNVAAPLDATEKALLPCACTTNSPSELTLKVS